MKSLMKDVPFDNIIVGMLVNCPSSNDTGIVIFKKQAKAYIDGNETLVNSIVIDINGWLPFCRRHENLDDWYIEI